MRGELGEEERARRGCALDMGKDGARWRERVRDAGEGGAKCRGRAN